MSFCCCRFLISSYFASLYGLVDVSSKYYIGSKTMYKNPSERREFMRDFILARMLVRPFAEQIILCTNPATSKILYFVKNFPSYTIFYVLNILLYLFMNYVRPLIVISYMKKNFTIHQRKSYGEYCL